MQQFLAMIVEERSAHVHISGRKFVMDAVAGRAYRLMRLRRLCQPLPASRVEHGAALRAHRGFRKFVSGLVGIVSRVLDQAVTPDRLETSESGFHLEFLFLNSF
jgi:hypothetical protein